MIYSVYKITNLINGKIYVGQHGSDNIWDDYFGSGSAILAAIKKYGKENFKKEILKTFKTRELARLYECYIVDKGFVEDRNTYNLSEGGNGSWSHTRNCPKRKRNAALALKDKNGFKGKTHTERARRKIGDAKKLDSGLLEQRIKDYKEDDKRYGLNSRMAKKWGITSQKAGSFMKHNNFRQYK